MADQIAPTQLASSEAGSELPALFAVTWDQATGQPVELFFFRRSGAASGVGVDLLPGEGALLAAMLGAGLKERARSARAARGGGWIDPAKEREAAVIRMNAGAEAAGDWVPRHVAMWRAFGGSNARLLADVLRIPERVVHRLVAAAERERLGLVGLRESGVALSPEQCGRLSQFEEVPNAAAAQWPATGGAQ